MNILLGISSSIAAYKTPELIRRFTKKGHAVHPILTQRATQFVTPLSLKTVSEHPVYQSKSVLESATISHLDIIKNKDVFVIAPASANVIAQCAHGIADDLLTTAFLAYEGPKLICPAMHREMWENPVTQSNIQLLKDSGCAVWGPESGALACGDVGAGRLMELDWIVAAAELLAFPQLDLNGKKLVITAGGTQELLDDVRVLTNRSTGKSGLHLALAAAFYQADVTLITTVPITVSLPNLTIQHVQSAEQMRQAVISTCQSADTLIMAAAVSDYTLPKSAAKLKRSDKLTLKLHPTQDILKTIKTHYPHLKTIGYCLETPDVLQAEATRKLISKNADILFANTPDVIGQDTRTVMLLKKSAPQHPELLTQVSLAKLSHSVLSN